MLNDTPNEVYVLLGFPGGPGSIKIGKFSSLDEMQDLLGSTSNTYEALGTPCDLVDTCNQFRSALIKRVVEKAAETKPNVPRILQKIATSAYVNKLYGNSENIPIADFTTLRGVLIEGLVRSIVDRQN